MPVCRQCGFESPESFRFCPGCGAELEAAAVPLRQSRKVVTALFCDVTGSTALGEELDPEVLRGVINRYFQVMRSTIERHGGTVEKFIGDAVMAVFGIPVVREDDALRAVRAAFEIRERLPTVAEEVGVELRFRTGVNTGPVLMGEGENLAIGDAVNVAARLEQAAGPGEILIGRETWLLVRDAVNVEKLAPFELKGKREPVTAYRLLSMSGEAPRLLRAPLVGRVREQRLLTDAWERTVSERSCQLFTILGPAGVGKSRLAAEFLSGLADVTVVSGRCLSYGEGITYWPVVEVVMQLSPPELDPRARETLDRLLGKDARVSSSEEIAWAFRKLLEAVADERPLVCVFDDLHWGEETFLDLVEHAADLSRDAPILLLCMARPELLDRRTGWAGGKVNATTVLLEPLAPAETELLIDSLANLNVALRTRILEAAEGNPLFVEQMVALLQESGEDEVTVPPTIQALLAARLDQLEPGERDVLQCGSVEGRIFHCGAVQTLSPDGAQVTACLTGLVRKELVRPDRAQLPGEDAFRFRHLLIRDAAYNALSKAARAELHERFAEWLEQHGADLVELDEMLGYHLEQAYRYRQELDQSGGTLADRAATKLGVAGRRALGRGDMNGASNLLERAATLLGAEDETRIELEIELADALLEAGRLRDAESLLESTVARAAHVDRLLHARAEVGLASVRRQTQSQQANADIQRNIEPLVTVFEEAQDHRGAADALRLLGLLARWAGNWEEASDLQERALLHARRAGDERREASILRHMLSAALWGPEHVESALARCRAILDETSNRQVHANCLVRIGGLEGLAGDFDAAREAIIQARAIMDDLGLRHLKAHSTDVAVLVEMLAQDYEAAEREARAAYAILEQMGDRTYQAAEAHLTARALEADGRLDEAEEWLLIGKALDDPSDPGGLVVQAQIMAHRGLLDEAEQLARTALEQTGGDGRHVPSFGDPCFTLAEILALAGRTEEARQAAKQSLRRYQAKGIVPLANKARMFLTEIQESSADD